MVPKITKRLRDVVTRACRGSGYSRGVLRAFDDLLVEHLSEGAETEVERARIEEGATSNEAALE